ncbi:hypothetical protein Tco_0948780 [Tanacetum coccineum]
MNEGDVTNHIAKVLEITEWIKMPNVEKNELRLHVFSKSLSGDAETWWNNEINRTTITWSELLWEFYLNERIKGTIGDLDKYNEPCEENTTKTCSDTFYKPYLDAQEAKDIYEVIDKEYSLIPIPARRDIDNPDDLCRTEEFTVVRHSIGDDEEFVTVGPSKINIVERTPGSMDKGKAKMIELEKLLKMKEQIRLEEELDFKLQAEEEEQARLAREKA